MKIKICGLFNDKDIDFVNEAKPDYIGFVFAKSKRQVDFKKAYELKQRLDKDILAVGVFVNDDINFIKKVTDENIIDIIQLHGKEDEKYIDELKSLIPNKKIIKAITVNDAIPLNVDYILFDGKDAGSGVKFNWEELPKNIKGFFLAGGINLDNIDEAMKYNPFCIDTSSGVETDGIKDKEKIIKLVRRVHNGK